MWDDAPPAGAPTTLRTYVSALRRTLRGYGLEGVVVTGRGGYALAGVETDVARFRALTDRAAACREAGGQDEELTALSAALALWRGPAMASLTDAAAVASLAQRLEEHRRAALHRWAQLALSAGRALEVAAALAPVCEEDPTQEQLWEQWMRALYAAGRHGEAIGAYRVLHRRLADELGLEPSAALRELQRAMLSQDPALDAARHGSRVGDSPPGGPGAARTLPAALRGPAAGRFVGREWELAALDRAAALARAGSMHVAVLRGEAGIGKTRLAGEWAARTAQTGTLVLYGRCDRDSATPFQPLVEALSEHLASPAEPPLGPDALALARRRRFDAVTRRVLALSAERQVLLILEDVHWADASTRELITFLARRAGQMPLLLLLTARPGEEAEATLGPLAADPGYRLIDLAGLEQADLQPMLAEAEIADAALAEELHRLSGGNPLLVRQAIAALERVNDAAALGSAPAVAEIVAARLAQLDAPTRAVLTLAALLGEEFELTELEAVAAADGEALAAVETGLAERLLTALADAPDRYRFNHDLIRQGVLRSLSPPRRARLHERIGEALAALPGPAGSRLAALAGHFAAAARPGHVQRAGETAQRAGEYALAQFAFEQAAAIAQRGLDCLALEPGGPTPTRCELLLLLAQARLQGRDIAGCQVAAVAAGDDARALGLTRQLARAAITASYLNRDGHAHPAVRSLCEDALRRVNGAEPALAAEILAGLADYAAGSEADGPEAITLSARAVSLARTADSPAALSRALFVHGDVLEPTPRMRERRVIAAELGRLAAQHGDLQMEVNALHLSGLVSLQSADVAAFDDAAARIEALRGELAYWYTDLFAITWRGMRALLDGRHDEVEPSAEALLAHAGHEPNAVNLYLGQLFTLRWEQGRLGELRDPLRSTIDQNPGLGVFRCALALALAEGGAEDEAARLLSELTADGLSAVARDATWMISLAALSETAATVGDRAAAETLIGLLEPYRGLLLIGTRGFACLGPADLFLGRLHAVCGRSAEARRQLAAAVAIASRSGSLPLKARAEQALTAV